jgi:hypothetical protein
MLLHRKEGMKVGKAKEHRSDILFPFFFGLLTERENKKAQYRTIKMYELDHDLQI